jgi:DNA-binding NarL/FixJ family response regulator
MIRVLVADDFPLVREALAEVLGRDPDIEIVGTAADGDAVLNEARALRPDLVVLDLCMPGMSGMTALCRLVADIPDARVLILTATADPELVVDAASSGAAGYLEKRASSEELVAAVKAIHRGEAAFPPALLAHLVTGLRREAARTGATCLTETERDLLRLVSEGRSDTEISRVMFISPRTVQSHLTHIRAKVGIRRRVELARWAVEHQIT